MKKAKKKLEIIEESVEDMIKYRLNDSEKEIIKTRDLTEDEIETLIERCYFQDLYKWYKKYEPCAITSFGGVYLSEGLFLWADGSIEDEDYFIKL